MQKTHAVTLGLHLLEVEITTRCNLNCGHCYNRTRQVLDLPVSNIVQLFEWAEANNVSRFVLSGGEAAMHPDFSALMAELKSVKRKTKLVIQSNGLVGERVDDVLGGVDIVHLSFELDGSLVRASSVEKMVEIARLFRHRGVFSYFFATIHPGNIERIDEMVEIATKAGIDIGFNLCISGHQQRLELSTKQRFFAAQKLHQFSESKKTLRFTSPYSAVLKDQQTESYCGNRGGCTAGIAACVVLPNGDVSPCPFFRIKAGNIYERDMTDIWLNSEIFSSLRDRSLFDAPCGSCKFLSYCGGCRASAYAENGIRGSDPQCILDSFDVRR